MVRVALVGLGAIGTEVLKHLVERAHEVVAVVDSDPAKAGRHVSELAALSLPLVVHANVREAQIRKGDVVVFTTGSKVSQIAEDASYCLGLGAHVVTTSEQMAFPGRAGGEAAPRLEETARANGATAVGVGVNPGFVMDWVPALIASASKNPTSIHVVRSVDVSKRRKQLQSKVGVGMAKSRFERELQEGTLGHVGLAESAELIALSLGHGLEAVRSGIFPVLGSDEYVMGVRQFVEGKAGACQVRLDLEMTLTSADFDVIEVKGEPHLRVRFEGGVFGDSATVALVVSAAERVHLARPGLITVLELPLVRERK
jgi:hypothetical protein